MKKKLLLPAVLTAAVCLTALFFAANSKTPVIIERDGYMAQNAAPSQMPSVTSKNIYGDADRNGNVDTYDALLVLKYSIGIDSAQLKTEFVDVDANGTVDSTDALLILRYSCGLADLLPVENLTAKQSGNPQNGSIAVEYGPYIFYTDLRTGIFRSRTDGSEQTLIRSCTADSLTVMDGYVYFIDYARAASICRTDIAGDDFSVVVQRPAACLSAYDGRLYYIDTSDGYSVCSSNADGTQTKRLADGKCGMPKAYEGSLYYIKYADTESGSIQRLDLASGNTVSLGKNTDFFDVYGGYVYYINRDAANRIYRMTTDGKTNAVFCSYGASRLNVYGDSIYFLRPDEGSSIYRLSLDKSAIERITRAPYDYISLAGDFIFCTDEDMTVCRVDKDGKSTAVLAKKE